MFRSQSQTQHWQSKKTDHQIYLLSRGKSPLLTPYSWLLTRNFNCRFCHFKNNHLRNHLMHECPYRNEFIPLSSEAQKIIRYSYYQKEFQPLLEEIKIRSQKISKIITKNYSEEFLNQVYQGTSPLKTPLSWLFNQVYFCPLCYQSHFLDECSNLEKFFKKKRKCVIL